MSSILADQQRPHMSANAGGGGGVAGSQPMSTAVHRSRNKLWRSNSIFDLCFEPRILEEMYKISSTTSGLAAGLNAKISQKGFDSSSSPPKYVDRGNRKVIEQTEYQAFFQSSELGFAHPLTCRIVLSLPPLVPVGGVHTRLRESGWADPFRTRGKALWYSCYSIIALRGR